MQRRKLFLIDGMSCAYRAFYAIRELRTSSGEPTNAVYGFTNTLLKIIREHAPDALAVVFDSKAPTFRHERYEAYKAHRKPMPEDLVAQLPIIREVLGAYHVAMIQKDGVEADDLMASLAERAVGSGYDVYLVTSDKDMLQIIREHVTIMKPESGELYDRASVLRRYGVEPQKIVDVLALSGDASDNVPGVPGIGEKTAVELVREFGDVEGVLRNVERIKGEKKRDHLKRFADQARLSRDLVTLRSDIPIEVGLEECQLREPDRNRVAELFRKLEFKKLHAEVAGGRETVERAYRCVNDEETFHTLLEQLAAQRVFALDLETTGGEPMEADAVGIAFSMQPAEGWYVPLNGKLDPGSVASGLRPILEHEDVRKVGQNIKFDILALRKMGIELRGVSCDTMIAAYLLNPAKTGYGLDDLALEYLDMRITPASDILGSGKKRKSMGDVPLDRVADYACEKADVTLQLFKMLELRIEQEGMGELFREVEMPLVRVLADMEERGISLDSPLLDRLSVELQKQLDILEGTIYEMAGERFMLNSPMQLGRILFEKLRLPVSRKIKTGYSTDYDALLGLSLLHPLPAKLLEYRQLSKLKSTYIDALPRMVNPRTGRIHASFNQTGTATGRLSSSDPNLQNIPVRTELGRRIRAAFIPGDKGMVFLSADYSQIDLRILAHLSGDGELTSAFESDADVHSHTACAIFGVDPSRVTPEMRRQAKTINFGIVYGMSAYGLSRELGIDPGQAQGFITRYFDYYRGVRAYIEESLAAAEERGYVATILNRRRSVPELRSKNRSTREIGQRIAINTPIQGSAADLIKIAMRDIGTELSGGKWRAAMLIQIHDELLFEVDRGQASDMGRMVKEKMEGARKFRVPIKVNLKTGENWGEL